MAKLLHSHFDSCVTALSPCLAAQDAKVLEMFQYHEDYIPEISPETSLQQFPGQILYLHNGSLENFNIKFLDTFQILTVVSLDKNMFTGIPTNVLLLPHIKIISLQHCKISAIPAEIVKATTLEALYLNHNRISSMEPLLLVPNLKILSLSVNFITEIPKTIGNNKSLVYLDVSKNALLKFPTEALQCDKLEYLSLSHNFISEIPATFKHTAPLKVLLLDQNRVKILQKSLVQLGIPDAITITPTEVLSDFLEEEKEKEKNITQRKKS